MKGKLLSLLLSVSLVISSGIGVVSAGEPTPPMGERFADCPYELWTEDFFDFAAPTPEGLEFTQPDGTVFEAYLTPMEIGGTLETPEGYTIVQDADGWWTYAEEGDGLLNPAGKLVPSSLKVGKDIPQGLQKQLGRTPPIWLDEEGNDVRDPLFDAIHSVYSPANAIFTASMPEIRNYVVLLVEFQDVKFQPHQTREWFQERISGLGTSPTGSVTDFYYENSHGKFMPILDVYGPFTSSYNLRHYDYQLTGQSANSAAWMINNDIGPKVKDLIDWDYYDNTRTVTSGYRSVDMVVIIQAGPGKEATGQPGHIWSHATTANFRTGQYGADGRELRIRAVNMNPGIGFNIGVVSHEMGHSLGEPDYYATNYLSAGTGDWDIMAGGSWLGDDPAGSNPMHFNPFSKIRFGWVQPTVITGTTLGVELRPRSLAPDLIEIPLGGSGTGTTGALERIYIEYVSNRAPGAIFDKAALGSGLLVWHYDAGGTMNTPARYRMAVQEYDFRDGTQELRLNFNRGEPTDPWWDTAIGMTPYTTPNTNRNTLLGGTRHTGWHLINISDLGPVMTLDIVHESNLPAFGRMAIDRPAFIAQPVIAGHGPAVVATKVYNQTGDTLHHVLVQFSATVGDQHVALGETVVPVISPNHPVTVSAVWEQPVPGKYTINVLASVGEEDVFVIAEEGIGRVFARPASVLIVDDDDGYTAEDAYEGVLTSLGVPYVLVTGTANLATLMQYDLVIWHAGQPGRQQGQLSVQEIANLKAYLNAGGKLWINSPRLAAALGSTGAAPGVDPAFLRDYLGTTYPMSSQAGGGTIYGLGHPIGGVAAIELRNYPGRAIQDFLRPIDSRIGTTTPLLGWSRGDHLGMEVIGNAAHNHFHVVYFGFCLSQVISGRDRLVLTQQVLDHMGIATVYFDQDTYLMQAAGNVKITLRDPGAVEPEVLVTSERQPAGLVVRLVSSETPGTFTANINVQKTGSRGNVLLVNDTDTLHVSYLDGIIWATTAIRLRVDKDMPPTVHHDFVFNATDAQPLPMMAVVTDDIRVQSVDLYYRVAGSHEFIRLRMEREFHHAYTTVIPAAAVTPMGLEYYIVARDSKGNLNFRGTPANPQFVVVQPRTLGQP